jgi:carboxypeptidase C (cathepsin A)
MINRKDSNIEEDDTTLILWIEGGPGCSSMLTNYNGIGPYAIDETGKVTNNEITWSSKYHLLFIDNPLGAGYSLAANRNEYVTTETEMADNLYGML